MKIMKHPAPRRTKGTPNEIDAEIGANLRLVRQSKDFTMRKLSKELKITYQQIQKYERGNSRIAASRLCEIADILQVPITFLLPEKYRGEIYHG